jgi:HEAT repeat protein
MSRSILRLSVVVVAGLLLLPTLARAQLGSGGRNPMLKSNDMMDDSGRRAGKETDENVVRDATKAMEDASPKVRIDALTKLRFVHSPKAVDLLMKGLSDPDVRVKVKAIDILGARQTTEAVPSMCQYLFLRSTEPVVKLHITAALGRIGDARGALPVMQYLSDSTDERARGTAVYALGEIGDTQADDLLTKTATDDSSATVRRLAQEALEKIQGELPIQRVVQAAKSDRKLLPTDERLSKLREMDAEMHKQQ